MDFLGSLNYFPPFRARDKAKKQWNSPILLHDKQTNPQSNSMQNKHGGKISHFIPSILTLSIPFSGMMVNPQGSVSRLEYRSPATIFLFVLEKPSKPISFMPATVGSALSHLHLKEKRGPLEFHCRIGNDVLTANMSNGHHNFKASFFPPC